MFHCYVVLARSNVLSTRIMFITSFVEIEIAEFNNELVENPSLANADPYGDGWLFELELMDSEELDSLKDAEAYEASLDE